MFRFKYFDPGRVKSRQKLFYQGVVFELIANGNFSFECNSTRLVAEFSSGHFVFMWILPYMIAAMLIRQNTLIFFFSLR